MTALMNELLSHGCILQGREKLAGEILAKHLENVAPEQPPVVAIEETHIPADAVLEPNNPVQDDAN